MKEEQSNVQISLYIEDRDHEELLKLSVRYRDGYGNRLSMSEHIRRGIKAYLLRLSKERK